MANFPPTAGFINSFNPDSPINTDKVFGGDDWIQFLQEVIKDNQFPISENGSSNGWDIALTVKASEVNTLQGISVTDPIITLPVGTPMMFYLDVAPPTWTILQAVDEHSTRLTKGLAAGGQQGGLSGGTNDFSDQFAVLAEGATPGVGDHTLTSAQTGVAPHTHTTVAHGHAILTGFSSSGSQNWDKVDVSTAAIYSGSPVYRTNSTNGNRFVQTSTVTVNQATGAAASEGHGHTVDLAVKWAACIIATKD
jgi:hypothetical protein